MDFRDSNTLRTTSRVSLIYSCSITALGLAAATMISAAAPPPDMSDAAKAQYLNSHMASTQGWKPIFLARPPAATREKGAATLAAMGKSVKASGTTGVTVPYWTETVKSPLDGITYNVSMVGSSPFAPHPSNTNVTYVPVAVRIHLGGFTLDPSAPSNCDAQSPARRFFNSIIFRPTTFVSNGVNVSAIPGGTQFEFAFQRANFWNAVKGTTYGVTLVPSRLDTIVVDWSPSDPSDFVESVPDNCGGNTPVAVVNINEFNNELLAIAATYAKPNQVPVSLADDVAIYVGPNTNNCCVLGYHNAVAVPGGTQLYAVGAYFDTNQVFGGRFPDITVWSHELGELIDDPFVQSGNTLPADSDLTPAWGHTGQVSGCQDNLEVGDPLTPAQAGNFGVYPVTGVGGFVYHHQDLAFISWFYRTASGSTGASGSFNGNLPGTGQGVCVP